jgi:hypothetical protein
MVRVGDDLMVHADWAAYLEYGSDLQTLNAAVQCVLKDGDADQYARLIRGLVSRHAFWGEDGAARLDSMFQRFGGRRVIHGHTPIARQTGQSPTTVSGPFISSNGRLVNVDHGLYLAGNGFVFDASRSSSNAQEIAL